MADINQIITQGIGTPSGIKFFILDGFGIAATATSGQVDPDSIICYAYIGGSWVELDDSGASETPRFNWGIGDNNPMSRLADVGELSISLNNSTGQYTPGGPSALAGWKKGIPFKIVFTYENDPYVRFRGVISSIRIRPNNKEKRCWITVVEWLQYALQHPIVNPGIQTNKRGDEVLTTLLGLIEIDPQNTEFETGYETFPTAFDTVTSHTKAYNEFAKVALSEIGYTYEKHDKDTGETIVFESSDHRHGWHLVDQVPLSTSASSLLENEDNSAGENEDGTPVHNNEAAAFTFDETVITDFDAPYGEHVINRATAYANPRRLSASPEVLFTLSEPIVIGSGQTVTIKGTYADPEGGLPINAQSMVTPVVTTDYLVNTLSDGSGTNISSDLVLTSVVYGTEGFTHRVTNNNASVGYITKYNCRGTGIFIENPIEHAATNSASVTEFETQSESINQAYKNDLSSASIFVESVVDEHNQPRVVLNSISFVANKSATHMMAFLCSDIGSMYYISIPELGIAGNYYIQGIEVEMQGKIIFVKWVVIAALSLQTGAGLTPIAVEFNGVTQDSAVVDSIDFGYLPKVTGLPQRTYSAWIYLTNEYTGWAAIEGAWTEERGVGVLMKKRVEDGDTGYHIWFLAKGTVANGLWKAATTEIAINTWYLVTATYDADNPTTAPVIKINNVLQTISGTGLSGTLKDETGASWTIGNINIPAVLYGYTFPGQIYDPRLFNRIITDAEITTLYNGGVPNVSLVTDGLVFQGTNVKTEDLASYVDVTLTSALTLRDNIFGAIGTPHGAPIGRTAP